MASSSVPESSAALQSELTQIEENARTLLRVSTTRATVAQTPKEVIWTLNKAKLYHYIPVVAAEQRHKVPLLLVFALMNKPYILDLLQATVSSSIWSPMATMSTCLIGECPVLRTKS